MRSKATKAPHQATSLIPTSFPSVTYAVIIAPASPSSSHMSTRSCPGHHLYIHCYFELLNHLKRLFLEVKDGQILANLHGSLNIRQPNSLRPQQTLDPLSQGPLAAGGKPRVSSIIIESPDPLLSLHLPQ